jgi:hypothetical protein
VTPYYFIHHSGWDAMPCADRLDAIITALQGDYLSVEDGPGRVIWGPRWMD